MPKGDDPNYPMPGEAMTATQYVILAECVPAAPPPRRPAAPPPSS